MKPAAFRYVTARTVEEAADALKSTANSKVLAGGQSLVPLMNFRLSRPSMLVDINGVASLSELTATPSGGLRVGALVRHQVLLESPLVHDISPIMAEAASHIGHWAIRNRGTLGGSLCHADPAAELPACMVALGAEMVVRNSEGERKVSADSFFHGFYTTALEADDILVAAEIPQSQAKWGFYEVVRRPGDFALAGALVECREQGTYATWFGFGERPTRLSVSGLGADETSRRGVWEELIATLPQDLSPAEQQMAVAVAEKAYRRAEEA